MGKILFFVYDEMADFEMTLAAHILGISGKEIVLTAYEKAVVTSKPGVSYYPAVTASEALGLDDVEGIIIPGGWNRIFRDELKELLHMLNSESKLIAAICAAPEYLAKAGILENRRYTTTLTENYLKEIGSPDFFPRNNFVNEKVVRDRNVITAVGNAFVDFAIEIADYFGLIENSGEKEEYSKYYKGLL
ncbi:MAG: DJ-1/PfpI family protein [Bacillota bacterium]